MPRPVPVLLTALAVVLAGAAPAAAAAGSGWQRPLPGAVLAGPFTYGRDAPFERGRRRGVDLRARPGAAVRAVCDGRVRHAGRVPRWGRGVSLRCGALVATELGLAAIAVRPGARVRAGATVGRLGARGVLRLGARRAGDRLGYLDPLELVDGPARRAPRARPRLPAGARGRRCRRGARSGRSGRERRRLRCPGRPGPGSGSWPAARRAARASAGGAGGVRAPEWRRRLDSVGRRCPSTSRRPSTTSTRRPISGTRTRRSPRT
ncbi:M23 family metallopeptidase [Baekduia soli]|uniref:M23 family metallopeptidase n=1 Tax=Baekduia soli TaxID=496014 RepID=UPI0016528554|nr:M23 family metallopeptidase [Baekduia soli]